MSFIVVIPSRHDSIRLPGKPLREIAGRPMIEHVWRRASGSRARAIVIATDDERIARVAGGFGARVCMTDSAHPSGTDRIAEVARRLELNDDQILVNLQGDEPLMPPALIDQVADDLVRHPDASIATLCEPIEDPAALFDTNVVKVVTDGAGYALYFSRAPVPWSRNDFDAGRSAVPAGGGHQRHVGLYAYRAGFLRRFVEWGPCSLERMESLEQLRALWHGGRIHVDTACVPPGHGVDTEDDLARAALALASEGRAGLS